MSLGCMQKAADSARYHPTQRVSGQGFPLVIYIYWNVLHSYTGILSCYEFCKIHQTKNQLMVGAGGGGGGGGGVEHSMALSDRSCHGDNI